MKDWCETDLSGKEQQGTRQVAQGSKEVKEVKQKCGIKPSCIDSDFGPIPWGVLGTPQSCPVRGKRAGVLLIPTQPVLPGTSCPGGCTWGGSGGLGLSSNRGRV